MEPQHPDAFVNLVLVVAGLMAEQHRGLPTEPDLLEAIGAAQQQLTLELAEEAALEHARAAGAEANAPTADNEPQERPAAAPGAHQPEAPSPASAPNPPGSPPDQGPSG